MSRLAYLALVFVFCLTWSSAFPVAKMVVGIAPPLLFLGVRFSIAAVLLVGFALSTGRLRTDGKVRVPWLMLMGFGVIHFAGYQGIAWIGMHTVSGGLTTIINSLNPVLVGVAAVPFLGEKMSWRKACGLLLGFIGAAFVVRNRIALGEGAFGILLVTIGMISMVCGTLLTKRFASGIDLFAMVGAQQGGAGLTLLIAGLASGERFADFPATPQLLFCFLWMIFGVSIASFLLWFFLLRRGSASAATSLHFLMPPLGLLIGWALLGEPLQALDLLGVVPVALGIRLATSAQPV